MASLWRPFLVPATWPVRIDLTEGIDLRANLAETLRDIGVAQSLLSDLHAMYLHCRKENDFYENE